MFIICAVWLLGCNVLPTESVSTTVDGFTETDNLGSVIRNDPDDWRTQERYRNEVFVSPAFPNPTINGNITVPVRYSLASPLPRVDVIGINTVGNPVFLWSAPPPQIGIEFYRLNLLSLSPTNNFNDLRGRLFRIRFIDPAGNTISYGDVKFRE
ncbi:MAG: hypothetical protein HY22_08555 [[Candidatus Thermochlorobacteriaceae] bacterium GBChlB]|nr:MAG: hypothetical protein HY22_08555 [[Candidatus Thermochlorobacteriaceae] bacterium GBChlB]